MYGILNLFTLFVTVLLGFPIVFCTIKSITNKRNLYGIPAAIIFICVGFLTLIRNITYIGYYYDELSFILWIINDLIFYPLLAILIFSKAKKEILTIPMAFIILPIAINMFENFEYYESLTKMTSIISLFGLISIIVLLFTRKYLKPVFFIPGVLISISWVIIPVLTGSNIVYILCDTLECIAYILMCKYVVTEETTIAIPQSSITPNIFPVNYNEPVYSNPYSNAEVSVAQDDTEISNELKKYKSLFESGLISEEDYNEKKKQILGI